MQQRKPSIQAVQTQIVHTLRYSSGDDANGRSLNFVICKARFKKNFRRRIEKIFALSHDECKKNASSILLFFNLQIKQGDSISRNLCY